MATAVKLAASASKRMIRQNAMRVALTSSKKEVNQSARLAEQGDRFGKQQKPVEAIQQLQHLQIYMCKADDSLNINLENISHEIQKELIDKLGLFLQFHNDSAQIPAVTFNYLSEEVYRYGLYMSYRKIGYDCKFTKYNNDRGLAFFKLIGSEHARDYAKCTSSYYRSGLPNNC